MMREIGDQPEALKRLLIKRKSISRLADYVTNRDLRSIYLIGCGSSYYACLIGEFYVGLLTNICAKALPSSELVHYSSPIFPQPDSLLIAVSRSGETTEVVKGLREAKEKRLVTLAITNSPNSTLASEADFEIIVQAGEERSVVMTKTFTSLVLALQLLSTEIGKLQGSEKAIEIARELGKLPEFSRQVIEGEREKIRSLASKYRAFKRFILLGAGPNFPICLEAALKLEETSYVPTEAHSTMEFRHGPMVSIDAKSIVIGTVIHGKAYVDHLRVLREISRRGAHVVAVANRPLTVEYASDTILIPEQITELSSPVICMIPLQLFAYYSSTIRGLNPDRPRHLAKVVKL